jgi:hypothetical protein
MNTVEISEKEAVTFIERFTNDVLAMPPEEFFRRKNYIFKHEPPMLRISYDENYSPFIGNTKGYTKRSVDRIYLTNSNVLRKIAEELENYGRDRSGGRVYFDLRGVYVMEEDRRTICFFNWHGPDPYSRIKAKCDETFIV